MTLILATLGLFPFSHTSCFRWGCVQGKERRSHWPAVFTQSPKGLCRFEVKGSIGINLSREPEKFQRGPSKPFQTRQKHVSLILVGRPVCLESVDVLIESLYPSKLVISVSQEVVGSNLNYNVNKTYISIIITDLFILIYLFFVWQYIFIVDLDRA